MKTNIVPGKIYRSSTDIKVWPIFVTKVDRGMITYYYMRDPDKLFNAQYREVDIFWSEIQ